MEIGVKINAECYSNRTHYHRTLLTLAMNCIKEGFSARRIPKCSDANPLENCVWIILWRKIATKKKGIDDHLKQAENVMHVKCSQFEQ